MPYWQYEILLEDIEDLFKKDKEDQEKGSDDYKLPKGVPSLRDMRSGKYTPKMPKIPQMKMPSMK